MKRFGIWFAHDRRASFDVRKARQRIQSYLLLRDRHFAGKPWSYRHMRWLSDQQMEHPAMQITLQGYVNALEQAESRRAELDVQISELLPTWSLAPVVTALQALRGVASVIAIALVAEIGDFRRFPSARDLMAYFGLVPSEHSSGSTVRSPRNNENKETQRCVPYFTKLPGAIDNRPRSGNG